MTKKRIAALIDIETNESMTPEQLSDYICEEFEWPADSGMHLASFSEVPADTTIEEITNAVVENRSKRIEEEYENDLAELA